MHRSELSGRGPTLCPRRTVAIPLKAWATQVGRRPAILDCSVNIRCPSVRPLTCRILFLFRPDSGYEAEAGERVMNKRSIYGRFMPEPPPARSTVAVAALPKGGLVEIEAIARRGSR